MDAHLRPHLTSLEIHTGEGSVTHEHNKSITCVTKNNIRKLANTTLPKKPLNNKESIMQTVLNITIITLLIGYLFLIKCIFDLISMLTDESDFHDEMIKRICNILNRHINEDHKKEAENEIST